jgi:hypothetical protein
LSNIERSDDSGPIFVRLDGVYFQRCPARPVGTPERPVEVVPSTAHRGAVEDFREIDRLLVQATIELPSERAVTVERAIAIARGHLGGQ